MKCFIINYNRLDLLKKMVDYLMGIKDLDIYIIDNNSTYQPLLDYYQNCLVKVIRMEHNFGYKVFWEQNIFNMLGMYYGERYILTDSDLDLSSIPKNFINILNSGLDKYVNFDKCGFSLEIKDLPHNELSNKIINWESQFWCNKLDELYFDAPIDTTFALYRVNRHSLSGIRTNYPYVAKHVPWYYENYESMNEDEKYYFQTIKTPTHWSEIIKNSK